MVRFVRIALIAIFGFAAATASGASNKALDTVNRAIEAMGGENAVRQVNTVVMNWHAQHWEPQSNYQAGGDAKPTGESGIVVARDFGSKAARLDWDRTKVGGGAVNFKYSEIYSDGVGIVDGVNVGRVNRTAQSLKTNQHTMSGIRLATFLREQQRASPLLVLDMRSDPKALTALPDQTVGGRREPLPKKANERHIELVRAVRKHNLDIERFAGGHGSTGDFRELAAIVDQTAPRSSLAPFELTARVRP